MQSQSRKICNNGSLAQLNRASDYGSEGCGFESRESHFFLFSLFLPFSYFPIYIIFYLFFLVYDRNKRKQNAHLIVAKNTQVCLYSVSKEPFPSSLYPIISNPSSVFALHKPYFPTATAFLFAEKKTTSDISI